MSTAEANKATFRRFHGAANTGDSEFLFHTIDQLVAPDAVVRTPLPIDATGPNALKQVWAMLLRIYPDIHLTVEDLIAEGDKVGRIVETWGVVDLYAQMKQSGVIQAYQLTPGAG